MPTVGAIPIDPVLLGVGKRSADSVEIPSSATLTQSGNAALVTLASSPTTTADSPDASTCPPGPGETKEDYEACLAKVTRKAPLVAACDTLALKIPKNAKLERLRTELVKHWFPPLATGSRSRRNASFPAARGTKTAASFSSTSEASTSTHHRGELRGGVSLSSVPNPLRAQRSTHRHDPSAARLVANTTNSGPQIAGTSVRLIPETAPLLLPSALPRTPQHAALPLRPTAPVDSPEVDVVPTQENEQEESEESEAALLRQYNVPGANAYEMLGYEDEDEEGEREGEDEEEGEGESDDDGPEDMDAFRRGVRVAAVQRFEKNRRPGGRKTQNAMVRAWNEFTTMFTSSNKIPDNIVDEHSLLLYIKFCAERPKRNRKGEDIPGTFVGASQLKKLFFGALRIRKEQDASLPTLARTRPATSVIVYDSIKTRMDEALTRERNGLVPEEDAPDIRANTWLSQVTEEQLTKVGFGFLAHRQLRLAVWGHLAWTAQHASGNRDKRTDIWAVLGMQSEEKAGKRGMRTVINPVYSTFIANAKPEMCPLGGFAFYFHYIYDEKKVIDTMKLDYKINKSWRQIRVLHGPKSPTTPFNEQNLYNLISKAYVPAGFTSRLKAHLARHLLGYRQESMGVDPLETSKLGWVRGQTYMDTYAPALPKTAILGAAGFRSDEIYDPVWRRVRVPEAFLTLVCPMAEEIREKVAGVEHLSGAFNHWEMVIELREYFFQCGAAIWQLLPNSTIFRLPAFQNTDVRNWMTTGYLPQLSALQAAAGDPLEIERIQNVQLARVLNGMRASLSGMTQELRELRAMVGRRTAMFTPARGFSPSAYHRNALEATRTVLDHDEPLPGTLIFSDPPDRLNSTPMRQSSTSDHMQQSASPRSLQQSSNLTPVPSRPESSPAPRLVTQVELVLPPLAAFFPQGQPIGMIHPVFGMRSARWVEDIFPAILRPALCWDVWCPSKTMEQFESIEEIWEVYSIGERICDDDDTRTKMKPPLKLVAQFFQHEWRSSTDKKEQNRKAKAWERFREIPEWIEHAMTNRRISLEMAIQELEDLRAAGSATDEPRGLNWLANHLAGQRKEAVRQQGGEPFNADPKASGTRSQEGESSNTDPTASGTTTTGKKRARAVDARRPSMSAKKTKTKNAH
ncbi:hypothetical protein B0H16DRAFT_1882008 [Mycena metata]|uniref:Ndc10 domain-containing protein n=1 Tax=Mycena metata TaxID=1033252 RepID=A0AAD7NNE2_9AGAR|nr:hypothetical protein B0H16DRAFT_1882008 [Mycena metata]